MVDDQIAFVGHSHLRALQRAGRAESGLQFVGMEATTGKGNRRRAGALPEPLLRALGDSIASARYVVSVIGGNAHQAFGLVERPHPFDFFLPENPDLPSREGVPVVPYGIVRTKLERGLQPNFEALSQLRDVAEVPLAHLESPPPVGDKEHILRNPNLFAPLLEERGVAPRWFRYKLWRVQSTVIREFCEAHGVSFLGVPRASLTEDGFLAERYYGRDPTHANAAYGALAIERAREWAREMHA